jgi:hypothetical protein
MDAMAAVRPPANPWAIQAMRESKQSNREVSLLLSAVTDAAAGLRPYAPLVNFPAILVNNLLA